MRLAHRAAATARRLAPAALVAVLAAPACAAEPAAVVTMDNGLVYHPESVTIEVGQTVEWRNEGLLLHTATADPEQVIDDEHVHLPAGAEPFASGDLERGDTFRHTFEVPGRYVYFCVPHEADGMVGEVIVEE